MDVALATVTVISLTMAFAMGIVTWRLTREERRRADARVAVLMADLDAAPLTVGTVGIDATPDRHHPQPERPYGRSVRPVERTVPRRHGTPSTPVEQSPTGLVGRITRSPVAARPFLATVAAAVAVLVAVSVTMLSQRPGAPPEDLGAGSPEPIELLSLAHARQGDYLAITGAIRNPVNGIERGQLRVTAIVFDRDGTVVGTGQTPLQGSVLPPGSDAPFSVSLPDADQSNRYRISFMQGQTSVPHIDRRRPNDEARSVVSAAGKDHL
jgi:hypothetical protein